MIAPARALGDFFRGSASASALERLAALGRRFVPYGPMICHVQLPVRSAQTGRRLTCDAAVPGVQLVDPIASGTDRRDTAPTLRGPLARIRLARRNHR
ncbi:hypothetical protein LGN19_37895 [Burkholderia sp. AU30198]|uniref:hypothetical protein n=1 Tax=Burkholderia sp. AU30198 TaxID=2879627 RepID=UPI001CF37B77|nr:hypothetical protein [Burkholderia sp. AU30198]MCA8299568.1 hypothetical protein [Burkholderia sp. AU30198]